MTSFEFGQEITLTVAFVGSDGLPAAGSGVTLELRSPDGSEATISGGFGNPSTGVYTYAFTPSASGGWRYRWVSVSSPSAARTEGFTVKGRWDG